MSEEKLCQPSTSEDSDFYFAPTPAWDNTDARKILLFHIVIDLSVFVALGCSGYLQQVYLLRMLGKPQGDGGNKDIQCLHLLQSRTFSYKLKVQNVQKCQDSVKRNFNSMIYPLGHRTLAS